MGGMKNWGWGRGKDSEKVGVPFFYVCHPAWNELAILFAQFPYYNKLRTSHPAENIPPATPLPAVPNQDIFAEFWPSWWQRQDFDFL